MSAPRASNLQVPRTLLQTLTRMDIVVNEDYYHMTTMDENVNYMKTSTSIVKFSSKPYALLLYNYLYFKILNSLFNYFKFTY
jgi:hypothetical protein